MNINAIMIFLVTNPKFLLSIVVFIVIFFIYMYCKIKPHWLGFKTAFRANMFSGHSIALTILYIFIALGAFIPYKIYTEYTYDLSLWKDTPLNSKGK